MVKRRLKPKKSLLDFSLFNRLKTQKNSMPNAFSLRGIWSPKDGNKALAFIHAKIRKLSGRRVQKRQMACPRKMGLVPWLRGHALHMGVALAGIAFCAFVVAPFCSMVLARVGYGKVADVHIQGLAHLKKTDIYKELGGLRYQGNVFDIDKEAIVERLKALAWVEDAKIDVSSVSREVTVTIYEQKPVAIVHNPDEAHGFSYIGRSGEIFTPVEKGQSLDYPVITGLSQVQGEYVEKSLRDILFFLQKISRNDPNLPEHAISEIHVAEDGQLTLYHVNYAFPIYVGDTKIDKAYKRLVRVLADIYARPKGIELANISYIKLDYMKDQVLVAENRSS